MTRMLDFEDFKREYQKVPVEEYPNNVRQAVPEPMVSVQISTYQHAEFIRDCLDGVLMQETNFPVEILVGEDESDDGTREICKEYADRHPDKIRLFLHRRENNIKIHGRPTGKFQSTYTRFKCRGKYIALCEGDDYWTDSKKLQKQVEFLETHENYVMVYHPWNKERQENQHIGCKDVDSSYQNLNKLRHTPHTSTRLFRSDAKYIDQSYMTVICGDLYMENKLINYGKMGNLRCLSPSVYRKHEGGMWTGGNKSYNKLDKIKTYYLTHNSSSNSEAKKEIFFNMIKKAEEFIFHEPSISIKHKFEISKIVALTFYASSWKKKWYISKRLAVKSITKVRMIGGKIKSYL